MYYKGVYCMMSLQPGFQGLDLAIKATPPQCDGARDRPEAWSRFVPCGENSHPLQECGGRSSRNRTTTQQTQHRISTRRHLHVCTFASCRSASQFFGDGTKSAGLSISATSMGYRQIGKKFGKGRSSTSSIGAEKSTYLDTKHHNIVHPGDIC